MRPLKLDQLNAFVEVAKYGSFTAAAKIMNLTQPAITHQVRELELRFQVPLFERVGNRVFLTKAGQKLHEYAVPLLEHDVRIRTAMRGFVHGWVQRVGIGSSMTLLMHLLPPVLRQLKADHPNLEINLKTGLTSGTLRLLKENELDLGLCALPVEDNTFDTVPLLSDELVAILPATLPHTPETVTPAFLSCVPLILGNKDSALRRSITEWLAQVGPVPRPVMELDNVEAIKGVVGVGIGSSIVPALAVGRDKIAATNLAVRPIDPPVTRQTGVAKLRGKHVSHAVSTVYEALLSLRQESARETPFTQLRGHGSVLS